MTLCLPATTIASETRVVLVELYAENPRLNQASPGFASGRLSSTIRHYYKTYMVEKDETPLFCTLARVVERGS
jgi:hypothetical protein